MTPTNDRSYDYELHNNEENESVEMQTSRIKLRYICLFNCIASVIDIIAIPLGCVGLICGIHGIEMTREIIIAFRSGKKVEVMIITNNTHFYISPKILRMEQRMYIDRIILMHERLP